MSENGGTPDRGAVLDYLESLLPELVVLSRTVDDPALTAALRLAAQRASALGGADEGEGA